MNRVGHLLFCQVRSVVSLPLLVAVCTVFPSWWSVVPIAAHVAARRVFYRRPCVPCVQDMPAAPSQTAARYERHMGWHHRLRGERQLYSLLVPPLPGAVILAVAGGPHSWWYVVGTVWFVAGFLPLAVADDATRLHYRFKPWCPWCRDDGGGGDRDLTSPPPPGSEVGPQPLRH